MSPGQLSLLMGSGLTNNEWYNSELQWWTLLVPVKVCLPNLNFFLRKSPQKPFSQGLLQIYWISVVSGSSNSYKSGKFAGKRVIKRKQKWHLAHGRQQSKCSAMKRQVIVVLTWKSWISSRWYQVTFLQMLCVVCEIWRNSLIGIKGLSKLLWNQCLIQEQTSKERDQGCGNSVPVDGSTLCRFSFIWSTWSSAHGSEGKAYRWLQRVLNQTLKESRWVAEHGTKRPYFLCQIHLGQIAHLLSPFPEVSRNKEWKMIPSVVFNDYSRGLVVLVQVSAAKWICHLGYVPQALSVTKDRPRRYSNCGISFLMCSRNCTMYMAIWAQGRLLGERKKL